MTSKTKDSTIPGNWEKVCLGEVITLKRGYDLPHSQRERGSTPIISSGGVSGSHSEPMCKSPGVVTGRYGTIGNVFLVTEDFWPLNTTLYVKDFKGNSEVFVFHLLTQFDFRSFSEKTGVPGVNRNDLHKVRVLKPPLPEQKKIAEILSTWDDALEKSDELIKAKVEQKRGLMQQLLTGRKRLPGFAGEWREKKLGQLFKHRKETKRPDLRLLSITSNRGVIDRSELEKKDSSNADKSKYLRIAPGDIGYNTMRMWQGVSALSSLEGIISPAYTVCIPQKGIQGEFAAHLFQLPKTVSLFHRYSQGLVSDTLNLKFPNFAVISVTVPEDFKEQKAIAEVLDMADQEISLLKQKRDALDEQKRGLTQQLLTGKVRVKLEVPDA